MDSTPTIGPSAGILTTPGIAGEPQIQERKALGACWALRCGGRRRSAAGPSPEPHCLGYSLFGRANLTTPVDVEMLVVRTDGFVDPCIPSRAPKPPSGPDWVHEVKHDGYRLIVRRDGETVRLFTRRGHDWTARYSAIAVTASRLRARSFTLDYGEAVVCGPDGVALRRAPSAVEGTREFGTSRVPSGTRT
jgi:ATP dependent DNA ligase-like protein